MSGDIPACWEWQVPADLAEAAKAAHASFWHSLDEQAQAEVMLTHWQAGRCAVCEATAYSLVTDHDHRTGLVRGLLCARCNTCEGVQRGRRLFVNYRERHPMSILGLRAQYWDPFTKGFAEPVPEFDAWRDNPMRGLL